MFLRSEIALSFARFFTFPFRRPFWIGGKAKRNTSLVNKTNKENEMKMFDGKAKSNTNREVYGCKWAKIVTLPAIKVNCLPRRALNTKREQLITSFFWKRWLWDVSRLMHQKCNGLVINWTLKNVCLILVFHTYDTMGSEIKHDGFWSRRQANSTRIRLRCF